MKHLKQFYIWLHNKFQICCYCHIRKATWWYGPGWETACEKCVPRGCSCNLEPIDGNMDNMDDSNWKEELDEQGRKYPCCEWFQFYTEKEQEDMNKEYYQLKEDNERNKNATL